MTRIHAFDPKPYCAWWIKIFTGVKMDNPSDLNYRIVWIPLVATDVNHETGQQIEGKTSEVRDLAVEFGYTLGRIRTSVYAMSNHYPDIDNLRRRIVPRTLQDGPDMDKYVTERLSELSNGAGI